MHHSRGTSLVSPVPKIKQEEAPEPPQRLRKKLQKSFPRGRFPSIRRSTPIDSSVSNKLSTGVAVAAQQAGTVDQPSLRLSPDLSDAKWHEYLRAATPTQETSEKRETHTPTMPTRTSVPAIIPEFSHLAVNNLTPRPSLDSSLSSPTSSISTRSSMRRRAKTPIYAIGQLENPACGRDSTTAERISSVDLIADQYRALLETQETSSNCTDSRSDPLPSRQSSRRQSSLNPSRYSAGETPDGLRPDVYQPTPQRNVSAYSPTSDDGTLVAFDEEAIYFKPMSFSPEPPEPSESASTPPPPPRNEARLQRRPASHSPSHNLSLQICTDLLVRELSTAMSSSPQGMGEDVSTLQIWVMIEAYERLRDQVLEMGLQDDEARNMEAMFETWLRALYSIHEKMTNDAQSLGSHYDVTNTKSEDLD
ncbi:hypothetical protein CCHL11_06248 [Colletotrichum chlorophyti]|uniref:Mating-type switching protein swi10 n=1 Tax=Colletotrichum chlorophyti TaxID=708187 RepID=A0A1Q8RLA3_9PEZI|nr:hypothetical protein CCHL11_06248 [Colletotrichum chlorophyti]